MPPVATSRHLSSATSGLNTEEPAEKLVEAVSLCCRNQLTRSPRLKAKRKRD